MQTSPLSTYAAPEVLPPDGGALDDAVGELLGAVVGFVVGAVVGIVVGAVVGFPLGPVVGTVVAIVVGAVVGAVVEILVGLDDGEDVDGDAETTGIGPLSFLDPPLHPEAAIAIVSSDSIKYGGRMRLLNKKARAS